MRNTAADAPPAGVPARAPRAVRRPGAVVLLLVLAVSLMSCGETADVDLPATALALSGPCAVEEGCLASGEALTLRVSMGPGIRALMPFPVQVEVQGAPPVDSVMVGFSMSGMDMGVNRYRLISDGADRWLGNVTLPVCTSGRSDWLAAVEVVSAGRRFVVELPFTLGK